MTPAGRRARAVAAALITMLATTGFHAARTTQAARDAAPSPTPTASVASAPNRVRITLTDLEPKAVKPGDVVSVAGTMTNISGSQLADVSVVLRPSVHRINTRYDLAREADPNVLFGNTLQRTRQTVGSLDANSTVSWQFAVPVDQLNLPSGNADFGTYPLAIDVRSTLAGSTAVTRLPTSMVWVPDGSQFAPTQISWLLPLTDGIHRGVGNTFLDDQLATDLAPSGRLGRLLDFAAGTDVPLTYLVDPALVDDATVMAKTGRAEPGLAASAPASRSAPPSANSSAATTSSAPTPATYQVVTGKGGTSDGTGSATAVTWLADLNTALAATHAEVVGLPYGDTDLVAVVRAALARETAIARSTGLTALSADVTAPVLANVVWPVGGTLDEPTLDDVASDYDTVVLDDTSLPPRDPNAVPGARTNLQTASGTVRAVLTDSRLSALLAPGAASPANGGARLAEQRFLADTMLITEQRPGAGSSVVVAPPRAFDPRDGFAATLLADSATMPWLRGTGLSQVASEPADGVARKTLVYNDAARAAELRPSELAPIAALRSSLFAYSSILGSSTTESFINTTSTAILRAESSALRGHPSRSAAITAAVASQLAVQTAQVYIVKPGLITLTSRKEKIPITVVNNLPDPVTVQIRLTAVNAARLSVGPQVPFTVPGHAGRHEVSVEVAATTGGRFDVEAQLWTPDTNPRPYGAPVPFVLNSTAYGAVALTIAAAAAGLVFLLSAIRITRRIRASRRDPTPQSPTAPPLAP